MTDQHTALGMGPAFGGFSAATKSLQSFAQEMTRLSKESVDDTTQLVEKLRAAKSIEEVVNIQTSYVQQSIAKYADYTRKFGEMLTVLPLEMVKQSRAAIHQGTQAVHSGVEQASQQVQHATDQVAQTTQNFQHATHDNNQSYNNQDYNNQNYNNNNYNNQNYDNNQNYNNNNQNYNNQNY
jgi:phasin family protein